MAKIDSRGFVDDGTTSLQVSGPVTTTYQVVTTTTLSGSGSVTVPSAGFFFVPASGSAGAGYFTGSVPAPGSYPGSQLILGDTYGVYDWQLTGSAFASGKAVFVLPIWATGSGARKGTKLSLSPGASVCMVSDGYYWLLSAASGSLTFSSGQTMT